MGQVEVQSEMETKERKTEWKQENNLKENSKMDDDEARREAVDWINEGREGGEEKTHKTIEDLCISWSISEYKYVFHITKSFITQYGP